MKQLHNAQGPISTLRQLLRLQSAETAEKLRRSVSRAASADDLPCTEYGEEVAYQHRLTEELLYLQHCRGALERAIDSGGSRLVWTWQDGNTSEVRVRRQKNHIRMDVRRLTQSA